MKKTLFKTALISSPIIALYGAAPLMSVAPETIAPTFLEGVGMLTIITLFIWAINFFIVIVLDKKETMTNLSRCLLSFGLVFGFTLCSVLITYIFDRQNSPPFYYPFIICFANNAIILIIIHSIILQFKKNQAEHEIAQLRISNMEAQHQQLIQQIQPHFLFNALSTLKSLIKHNTLLAEDYLIKLSDFLRYTIYSNTNKLVSFHDELEFTKDYIELQQIRFAYAIQFKLDIPEVVLKQYKIPIYSLQTLVENAIKHNAFSATKPLLLEIVYKDKGLKVSNNKIPKHSNAPEGIGLKNLNERYLLVCNKPIEIENSENEFAVTLKLI